MLRTRILISDSHDPYFNLAVEDTIFRAMPTSERILFLWRNADTVVIGKGQNPWKECNTRKMELDGVKLARRQTGGGAVFHDLGNSNFTFMAAKPEYDKSISTMIVLKAMKRLGVEGKASGRNDLIIETDEGEKKFSGSAYRETKDRGFHHGTLLLSADLKRLANYLNPDPKKLESKGITSVRSRVVNLEDVVRGIDHSMVCDALRDSFLEHFRGDVQPERITPESLPDLPDFEKTFEKQRDWNWNFGKSPDFSHELSERFSWGRIELHLDVQRGEIRKATIFSDCLFLEPLERLANVLVGKGYQRPEIEMAVAGIAKVFPEQSRDLLELGAWLQDEIN